MKLGGYLRTSTTDYPGKTAAVLFTQGCNWRCPYCRGSCLVVPQQYAEPLAEEKVMESLTRRRARLDGIVVSGGEPTIHNDLIPFLERLGKLGLPLKLDTNGSRPDMLREIVQRRLVSYIAMDVKSPLDNYPQATGIRMDPEVIRTSIWVVKNSGLEYEFRTTVIPGLHTVTEIKSIGLLVNGAARYVLQEYVSENALRPDFRNRVAFTRKTLEDMQKYFRHKVKVFEVRGVHEAPAVPAPAEEDPEPLAIA